MVRPDAVTHVIDLDGSLAFAALSGDFNPLHVDPVRARRLRFGGTVVHGVHALLSALDAELAAGTAPVRLTALRAAFTAPIATGTPFALSRATRHDGGVALTVATAAGTAQEITVAFTERGAAGTPLDQRGWPQRSPRELAFDGADGGTVPLRLDPAAARSLFPHAAARLPARQLAAIAASSQVVGMACPGLHSLFADLELAFDDQGAPSADELAYEPVRTDRRFGLVVLGLQGPGLTGRLGALFRPAPVAQPAFAAVRAGVAPGEFAAQRALIVGGSRGLGEVAAKVLAAGGADVVVTYYRGRDDAAQVAADIIAGGGQCRTVSYDAVDPASDLAAALPPGWGPSHVYYFSTPVIRTNRGPWDDGLFEAFCRYYVHGFARLIENMERALPEPAAKRRYVYPSTVYVDETPPALCEYAAAKAAGEVVGRALSAKSRGAFDVVVSRLPRLRTDQTAADDAAGLPPAMDVLAQLARGVKASS